MASEWTMATLAEVCEFRAGSVFKPALQGKSSGTYPFVKVSDMNLSANAVMLQVANNWVSEADLRELRAKPFPPGTVVFAKIGEALRQNRLRQVVRKTVVDNNMMGAVPRPHRVDPRFFYYALSQFDFSDIAQGTALPYLTVSALSDLSITVPSLREQCAIAHVLGTLDDKIELNRRMNETLEAIARTLFQSFFVDFEPVRAKAEGRDPGLPKHIANLFPSSFEESGLGELPKGWHIGKLGDVLEQRVERCVPSVETAARPYVPIDCISSKSLFLTECNPGVEAQSSLTKFYRKDLLFGAMRPYFHKVCIAPFDGTTRTTAFVLFPRAKEDFAFATLLLHDPDTIAFATRHSTGSTIPYAVWSGSLEEMPVIIPPAPVRLAFDEAVRPLLDRIPVSYFQKGTLTTLRDTLLPKLISGELRVKDAERVIGRDV